MKKYKELEKKGDIFFWVITDEEYREFATCDCCGGEAPLAQYNDWIEKKELCFLCAHTTGRKKKKRKHASFNFVLRQLGAFDDNYVLTEEEYEKVQDRLWKLYPNTAGFSLDEGE